jgi:hypothetical protein
LLIRHFCFVERKVKLSSVLVAANRQSAACDDVSFSPSKLVAVVSPQRRPQSEKKVYKLVSVKPVLSSEWAVFVFLILQKHLQVGSVFTW